MSEPIHILMAEDDPEDRLLIRDALEGARLANRVAIVNDGRELLAYLRREGAYATVPRPDLVLLDLNMPHMDGRAALREMKGDRDLRSIPVVVLTSSTAQEDMLRAHNLGVHSYMTKPVTIAKLIHVIQSMGRYWIEIVRLPPPPERRSAWTHPTPIQRGEEARNG